MALAKAVLIGGRGLTTWSFERLLSLMFPWVLKNTCDGEFNPLLHDKVKCKTGDDQILEGKSLSSLS